MVQAAELAKYDAIFDVAKEPNGKIGVPHIKGKLLKSREVFLTLIFHFRIVGGVVDQYIDTPELIQYVLARRFNLIWLGNVDAKA